MNSSHLESDFRLLSWPFFYKFCSIVNSRPRFKQNNKYTYMYLF